MWKNPKIELPKKYETVLVRLRFLDTDTWVVIIGKWNGTYWETADVENTRDVYADDDVCIVDGWQPMPEA